ncbi:hypothetical protein OsJ_31126 [Oryza sativa Japonica Group]|uniref:FAR1 domain-containing protein n=1 Tax=Oryza sativa subsp. japonica TaxID=39947 RepID=A3C3P8_ORYSJ|nr:hypothetical protein OsJ_31126 [Oryza sativa Japonica Group]
MDNPEIEHAASTPRGVIPSTPPGAKIVAIAIADEPPPAPARSDRVLGKRARKDIAEGCSPSPTATRAMRAGVDYSMEMHTGEFASDGVDDPQQCTPRRTPYGPPGTLALLYTPGRVTAMEQSMREYAIAHRGYVFDQRQGIEFDLLSEAYDFYNLYSFECGFGIRRGKSYTNTKQFRNWQQLGKPERANSSSSRCGCNALLYLKRTDDDGWYVAEHRAEHNHALSDSCGEKINWPSHSQIDIHTKGLI